MPDEQAPTPDLDRSLLANRPFIPPEPPPASGDRNETDEHSRPHRSEAEERQAAWERGRLAREARASGRASERSADAPLIARSPFAALAENVRDYAIFLMDPHGVILYWGEGARLMKWWTRDEAEGAHLRLLYPENGSEDGTAEAHLREAAERGEYVGEGQRVRSDRTKFWAGITLTALRDHNDQLVGFAKVTRDLTARMAVEVALATAGAARQEREAALKQIKIALTAQETLEEAAEFAVEQARSAREYIQHVLEPELATLRIERANKLQREGRWP